MNESQVSLVGWVGSEVELRETTAGAVARFRLACTPRYYRNNEWHDGATSWFTVNAWRALGRNVNASVAKGDPVVVMGRMRVEQWQPDGEQVPRTLCTVDATVVGHDLNRGTSSYEKPAKAVMADPSSESSNLETRDEVATESAA